MKVKTLKDRILIKRVDEESKTKGGIIIPDSAKEKPQEGLVVAVGPGKDGQRHPGDPRGEGGRPHPVREIFRHGHQG